MNLRPCWIRMVNDGDGHFDEMDEYHQDGRYYYRDDVDQEIKKLRADRDSAIKTMLAIREQREKYSERLAWLERWITDNSSGFEIYPIGPDLEYAEDGNTVVDVRGWCLGGELIPVRTLGAAIDVARAAELEVTK